MNKNIAKIREYVNGRIHISIIADDKQQIGLSFGDRYDIKTERGKHWISILGENSWTEFCVDEYSIEKNVPKPTIHERLVRDGLQIARPATSN